MPWLPPGLQTLCQKHCTSQVATLWIVGKWRTLLKKSVAVSSKTQIATSPFKEKATKWCCWKSVDWGTRQQQKLNIFLQLNVFKYQRLVYVQFPGQKEVKSASPPTQQKLWQNQQIQQTPQNHEYSSLLAENWNFLLLCITTRTGKKLWKPSHCVMKF